MKFLKTIFMGIWGVIFSAKELLGGKNKTPQKPKVFLKGRHGQMLLAARRGNIEAQMELATCYSEGDGVEQNYTEAAHWFGEAARLGDARGQFSLGICYANGQGVGQDYEQAVNWFRFAAEQGNVGAQVSLGICLQKALGGSASPTEAAKWFKMAAD